MTVGADAEPVEEATEDLDVTVEYDSERCLRLRLLVCSCMAEDGAELPETSPSLGFSEVVLDVVEAMMLRRVYVLSKNYHYAKVN